VYERSAAAVGRHEKRRAPRLGVARGSCPGEGDASEEKRGRNREPRQRVTLQVVGLVAQFGWVIKRLRDNGWGLRYHAVTQIFDMGSRKREGEDSSRFDEPRGGNGEQAANDDAEDSSARKERVLHTRVPAVLERELKRLAETLRVPVSNLVRAVLEDAVAVADHASENVETRLKTFASSLEQERDKLRRRVMRDPLDGVFAFQPIKLAQPASCAKCKADLRRGENANLGLRDDARPNTSRVFVCDACIPAD
jgi:hypothetical protein